MRNVARALLYTAAFLELSDEETIQLDASAQALEQIAASLNAATPEESALLKSVAAQLAQESRAAGPAFAHTITFYETFMENFGVGLADQDESQ